MASSRKSRSAARRLAPETRPWTLIGPNSLVKGDLVLDGNLILHGRLEGTVFAEGEVQVGPDATVEGGIHARSVVVEGTVRGRIEGLESVTLRAGCAVHAEVDTEALVVDDGARFFGERTATRRRGLAPRVAPYRTSPGNA